MSDKQNGQQNVPIIQDYQKRGILTPPVYVPPPDAFVNKIPASDSDKK